VDKIVIGVVEKPIQAQQIIDELIGSCRCDRSDIGIMARGAGADVRLDAAKAMRRSAKAAAETAAATETLLDGIFRAAGSVASRLLPGIGELRAVGPIAATLVGAGVGTGAGLVSALVDFGLPESQASYYADAVRRGCILITVSAKTNNIEKCAEQVLQERGALLRETRAT
jgi:hypothetical protein